jgi:outer membrane protein assembly factor BamC
VAATFTRFVPQCVPHFAKLGVLALAMLAAGCSTLEGDRIDYKSAGKGASLEVPPDLTQLSRESRYVVPGVAVTASGYAAGQTNVSVPTAANAVGDVRIERAGSQRWLVVNRSADKLWSPVRDFWQENGFLLTIDQQNLGIMETDWAENRAKLPQDFIRNALGKVLENLYSTGERDKFRTRLEINGNSTEIYVSHRGMVEQLKGNQSNKSSGDNGTIWEPRAQDAELETEFLRRLMVRLGVSQEQSKAAVTAGAAKPMARMVDAGGKPTVQLDEGFDRAWRRVGLALDRTGFTVEDRDRAQGLYFVRYVEPTEKKDPGFFAKLFTSTPDSAPLKFRIAVKSAGESTTVSVLDAAGAPEGSANAQRIVKVIADDLK